MAEILKNDFTGTWICRNGKTSIVTPNPEALTFPYTPFMGDNLIVYNFEGNAPGTPDWDLMERISEKDIRR